jgi:hypothetical protein
MEGEERKFHSPNSDDWYVYDFFKMITSLSLIILAAIMTISQLPQAADLKTHTVLIGMGIISLSGLIAFAGASNLAAVKLGLDRNPAIVRRCFLVAPAVLFVGIGYLLFMFTEVMAG